MENWLNPISWVFECVWSVFSVNNWKCSAIITKITSCTEADNSLEAHLARGEGGGGGGGTRLVFHNLYLTEERHK